ncbi:MAG: glycosyltransferase [Rivularia sp. (in: cyanobacteria)]
MTSVVSVREYYEVTNFQTSSEPRIMLFDLATGGHHPSYIRYLVEYWRNENLAGNLFIVVSPEFLKKYVDVVSLACFSVNFVAISPEEAKKLEKIKRIIKRASFEWKLFCKYARGLQINHAVLMYFDHFQLPLAFGANAPCSFSGIYFRPTFHYNDFPNYTPNWKDKIRQWRQKFILSRTLQNRQLKALFCLDSFAVEHIKQFSKQVKIIHLADPVQVYNNNEINDIKFKAISQKKSLNICPDRKVLLLFGKLNSRKGIYQTLEAIKLLPIETCKKICLLLVGEVSATEKLTIEACIQEILESSPVQIITNFEFITEEEVAVYFQMTDIVLAPYQRHVGMSGILLLAAAAQKPVLASDYGLMGQLVLSSQLGVTVDSTSASNIAKKLQELVTISPNKLCDITSINQFAKNHSSMNFSQVIFDSFLNAQ